MAGDTLRSGQSGKSPQPARATGAVHAPKAAAAPLARAMGPTVPKAQRTAPAPAPVQSFGGGGGSFDAGGGGALDAMSAAPAMSDDDYLAGDSSYQAQLAALLKAVSDYDADATSQKTKYEVDYGDSLKNLGWTQDNPNTKDVNEGAWNFKDMNTAAGRAFQNQENDFAGRGLLQSSLYGTANDNLTRSLNDQLGGINTGRQNFLDDLSRGQAAYKNENTLGQQQARAEALQRRAGGITI